MADELTGRVGPSGEQADRVIVDNRTNLPDDVVRDAIMCHWTETAALQFGTPTSFQLYATNAGGNVLNRSPFQTPSSVMDEIKLARNVAETDDDIRAIIDQMVHSAYRDGMENQHADLATLQLFNQIAYEMNLDTTLKELLREYVISANLVTLTLFTRTRLNFYPDGTGTKIQAQLQTPLVGVLPSEQIRVMTNDVFSTGELAYDVEDVTLKDWLDEYFADRTTPAKKEAMRREQPVIAAVFTGKVEVPYNDQDMFSAGKTLYTLNQRMVGRTTMPKGSKAYARPRMTANFALLEAKRLLNIMDYSLLQGGTNYIVVAKQGSDKLPAQQPEIDNLTDQVRSASRTGVLVGDHRLSIEIITPDLKELLSPSKRQLIGRKLAMAILSIPEQVTMDGGNEGTRQEMEYSANTITADRADVKRHIERFVYAEIVKRNPSAFTKGSPTIWHPKVVLSGLKDFFDNVVKARDRGDIPRKYAVEVLGYDYEAGVAQREREKEAGHDELMTPGSVPFSAPGGGPPSADNEGGRPPGTSSDNGRPGAQRTPDPAQRQRRLLPRRRGEPVRAIWDEERRAPVRVGELTMAILEEYPGHSVGRVTEIERAAVASNESYQHGPVAVIPVNPDYDVRETRAFRLAEGLSMIVGQRTTDGALVARALCFKEPQFDPAKAEEMALRWGYVTAAIVEEWAAESAPPPEPRSAVQEIIATFTEHPEMVAAFGQALGTALANFQPQVTVVMPGEQDKEVIRDEGGNIIGTRIVRAEVTS